jgi:hypothetical protein
VSRVCLTVDARGAPAARPTNERVDSAVAWARSNQIRLDPRESRASSTSTPAFVGSVDVGRQSFAAPFDAGAWAGTNHERVAAAFADPSRTALGVDFRRGGMGAAQSADTVGATKSSRASVAAIEPTARAVPVLAHSAHFGAATRGVNAREIEYDR